MGRGNCSFETIGRQLLAASLGVGILLAGATSASAGGYPPTTIGAATTAVPTTAAPATEAPTTRPASSGVTLPRSGNDIAPLLRGGVGVLALGLGAVAVTKRRTTRQPA
jgi:hypothetical protein